MKQKPSMLKNTGYIATCCILIALPGVSFSDVGVNPAPNKTCTCPGTHSVGEPGKTCTDLDTLLTMTGEGAGPVSLTKLTCTNNSTSFEATLNLTFDPSKGIIAIGSKDTCEALNTNTWTDRPEFGPAIKSMKINTCTWQ